MADMLRNLGGGGGAPGGAGGGMPDLASLMNNPMMMQMAQQMMANGGMDRLMSNPTVANMVNFAYLYHVVARLTKLIDEQGPEWRWHAIDGRVDGRSYSKRSVSFHLHHCL